MTLRLPLTSRRHATLISAFATTMSNQDNIKENLYSDLNSAIIKTPKTDKLIILGDFNARLPHRKKRHHGCIPGPSTGIK
ncbi:craniofacial development protein 2 [Biomphalaria glabrata]|nr:craniofacial development protein 2 [Biomphalaria glabrata]